jgi:uncharacterized SAM-binding protein YcdF (DUF218 family)
MEMTPFFFGLYKFVKYGVYPLTWIVGLFAVALILAWFPPSPRRLRWLRASATTGFLLLFLISSPVVSGTLMGTLEGRHTPLQTNVGEKLDAIVVLGSGIRDKGTLRPTIELTDESRHQTLCGADLYRQGHAPKLLITGGDTSIFGSGPREATAMKDWAVRLGVPSEAIVTEDRSRTTYENAVLSKRILGDRASILLVTSANHIPRATALFMKQGFRVTPSPCGYQAKNHPSDNWNKVDIFDLLPDVQAIKETTLVVEEAAGIAAYWLAGKL